MHRSLPTRWTCLACKHGNDADADACEQCGVPAGPSAEQVERAERVRATYRKWVIGQDWPASVRCFDVAAALCLVFVYYAVDLEDFNVHVLLALPLALVFAAAGAVARRIEKRARIKRLVAEEDEAEELALQRAAARAGAATQPGAAKPRSAAAPGRVPVAPGLSAGAKR